MVHKESVLVHGQEYSIETGWWAKQAGGSVLLKWGNMVVMANATAAREAAEGLDFFPMTIEYREKYYAAGKFPGGYIKRENRPSEKEILISRVIDRPIRPLFPENYYNEVQVFINLLSADKKFTADVHAITAASAALTISNVPFQGPVAGVKIVRVHGKFILFPTAEEVKNADINISLAGTKDAVTMIEGLANEASEADMLEAIKLGHTEIKRICAMQTELKKKCGKPTSAVPEKEDHSDIFSAVKDFAKTAMVKANGTPGKHARQEAIDKVKGDIKEHFKSQYTSLEEKEFAKKMKLVKTFTEELEVEIVRDQIFNEGTRADGRRLNEIRDIDIQVGVLPSAHGSSLFTRGETQSLGVLTLGTENNAQTADDIDGELKMRFYLHYNFPPFSVGEVKRISGPGRREIGHGKLAENSLYHVIPSAEQFPYVIRIVSEILESNGSSSMATICSGSLALMDAGVPIKRPVAGIAMGLITNGDKFAVLSDIAGLEDHFGDMDFKVAGTEVGITGFQLDTKVQGISYEIMQKAIEQAKEGRLHILGKMASAISKPRADLSDNAPRISTLQIEKDRIGELIGPGGKNIRSIIERTGVEINVNDDGIVTIASNDGESARKARAIIEGQFAEAEINKVYEGIVKKITDFGAFIEILPGREGLCHISKISHKRIANVSEELSEGQKVQVRVMAVDRAGKISLSIKDV